MHVQKLKTMHDVIRPSFMIIGAQKCGTTWLWKMMQLHPDTDLRIKKELQFFSLSKFHRKGFDWYYRKFEKLDASKIIGQASAAYFYDHVLLDNVNPDHTLPVIPELITNALPDIKVIVLLRDPVRRAISAYYHHLRRRRYSPFLGLREAAKRHPRLRIVERGRYAGILQLWQTYFPEERMLCLVFEEDVVKHPDETLRKAYEFIGANPEFKPESVSSSVNQSWGGTHLILNYYMGPFYGWLYRCARKTPLHGLLNRMDILDTPEVETADIEYLRSIYLPEKEDLEKLLGRSLDCWDYGDRLLH